MQAPDHWHLVVRGGELMTPTQSLIIGNLLNEGRRNGTV